MQATIQQRAARRVLYAATFWLGAMGLWILITTKVGSFHQINTARHALADQAFPYITHLGDGLFILLLAFYFLLRKNIRLFAGVAGGYLLSGLVVQVLKHTVPALRPLAFFEAQGMQVPKVAGVVLHTQQSFPSGHTASAFAFFVFIALIRAHRGSAWLLLPAFLVGYSRIYLSQHFTTDVWAGACIGTLVAWVMYRWLAPRGNSWKALFAKKTAPTST